VLDNTTAARLVQHMAERGLGTAHQIKWAPMAEGKLARHVSDRRLVRCGCHGQLGNRAILLSHILCHLVSDHIWDKPNS
jgi:hypothetical protein